MDGFGRVAYFVTDMAGCHVNEVRSIGVEVSDPQRFVARDELLFDPLPVPVATDKRPIRTAHVRNPVQAGTVGECFDFRVLARDALPINPDIRIPSSTDAID